ncbi:MAG TPA: peptidase M23, partial [Flammeovirgaceae bacterium]|nr:peptidase M23 [Flammeovirgaceae bacterium]
MSLLLLAAPALAQQKTKEQLQKERAENLRKIKEAEATLKQTSSRKKASVGQLNAINYQIKTRQKVINSLAEEINLLNQDIAENQEIINALNEDLEALKKEYAAMVYAAYKASNSRDKLMFLFAAESFNQLLRRLDYLKQYSKARKTQVDQIQAVQQMLLSEIETIEKKKQEKNQLLAEQLAAKKDLEKMRQKQRAILASLQQQEKKLKKELAQRRKSLKALDKLINDLIRREAEAAAKAAALAKNKAAAALSADFSKNKRQLPWPAEGFISLKFG